MERVIVKSDRKLIEQIMIFHPVTDSLLPIVILPCFVPHISIFPLLSLHIQKISTCNQFWYKNDERHQHAYLFFSFCISHYFNHHHFCNFCYAINYSFCFSHYITTHLYCLHMLGVARNESYRAVV